MMQYYPGGDLLTVLSQFEVSVRVLVWYACGMALLDGPATTFFSEAVGTFASCVTLLCVSVCVFCVHVRADYRHGRLTDLSWSTCC